MDELFEKRKKIIYEFICDEFYVPMKLKELSMLLQVPKDQKEELKAVMDSLEKEGRVHVTQMAWEAFSMRVPLRNAPVTMLGS